MNTFSRVGGSPSYPATAITKLAFRNRFTQAEKVVLELASLDDNTASMSERQQAAAIRSYLKDVDVATYIDLARAETIAGVTALEAGGLLGEGRASVILSQEIADSERPL